MAFTYFGLSMVLLALLLVILCGVLTWLVFDSCDLWSQFRSQRAHQRERRTSDRRWAQPAKTVLVGQGTSERTQNALDSRATTGSNVEIDCRRAAVIRFPVSAWEGPSKDLEDGQTTKGGR